MTHAARGMSIQTRLTLTIAGSFIGAILALLILALVLSRNYGIAVIPLGNDGGGAGDVVTVFSNADGAGSSGTAQTQPPPPIPEDVAQVAFAQASGETRVETVTLARQPRLLLWATAILGGFAVLAIVIAAIVSRRSLGRVTEITRLAHRISAGDLGQRLTFSGPDDEIRQLGDTFDRMLDRLEAGFARQAQFVANASHELRTPLTTARTALDIPLSQGRVPAELEPDVRMALRANETSERLIRSLMQLARARHDAPPPFGPVALDPLLAGILDAARGPIAARDLRLETSIAPDVRAWGDAALLELAMRNLVDNAIRHNLPGGEIAISLEQTDAEARLRIENTGPLLEGDLDRLREPFFRDAATRTQAAGDQGFGLGLALVESIVDLHGGTLTLAGRDDAGGLAVTVTLPVSPSLRSDRDSPGS